MNAEEDKFVAWLDEGKEENFQFKKPPNGKPVECKVLNGAGKFELYEDDKLIIDYWLSTDPGETFLVRLNTDTVGQAWKIHVEATGPGKSEFEFRVVEESD